MSFETVCIMYALLNLEEKKEYIYRLCWHCQVNQNVYVHGIKVTSPYTSYIDLHIKYSKTRGTYIGPDKQTCADPEGGGAGGRGPPP